jgi:phenylalanyl-tRNA synthetase beta chain
MSGSKVEFYTDLGADLENIVIGKILSIDKHPDADHLVVCKVDIGKDEPIQIVTGAPNTTVGTKVPVVLPGGKVAGGHDGSKTPGGIKIKKGKLRGVESDGMMCAIEELGSSRELFPDAPENGLYIMPDDAPVGEDAIHYLGLDDVVVDYEITSNRVDCFSIIGIARESAATFNLPFNPPVVKETGNSENIADEVTVDIENHDLCTRYTARKIKNVHIAESPDWMKKRLRSQGIRPINNIVDITNYVMEEYGQPMHAYDLSTISGKKIVVRNANDGEHFTTLDGQDRVLTKDMLMICDGEKAIGLAGIMGGENSMITDSVSEVLFEAATFDGTNIRLSSKKLGMRTDASAIFEKGLDPNNAIDAMNRACELVEELGAGEVVGGVIDVYPEKKEPIRIPFEPDRYNTFLGTDIPAETQLQYLKKEELGYDEEKNELIIPTFRQDLKVYADIAEEVARFFGYDKVPTTLPHGATTMGRVSKKKELERVAMFAARHNGFSQAMCYSFESPKAYDRLRLAEDAPERNFIRISNPLGEDFSVMRTLSLNGMLTSLGLNSSRRNEDVRLFELGNIYIPKALPLTELPDEREQFTLGAYGDFDFYKMKAVVDDFITLSIPDADIVYKATEEKPFLHPGRQALITLGNEVLGYLGEVHPLVSKDYGISGRAYVAVIDLPSVLPHVSFERKYKGIANFPASTRDISMVVPNDVTNQEIVDVIKKNGGEHLESVTLFDIYEGAQVLTGHKSMAYSLTFRAKDHSLADDEVNSAMDKILSALGELNIELRK